RHQAKLFGPSSGPEAHTPIVTLPDWRKTTLTSVKLDFAANLTYLPHHLATLCRTELCEWRRAPCLHEGQGGSRSRVPVSVSVERSRVDEPVDAGPVTTASLSLAESTPSSMAESTPSSMAEPTPVAESAPAASLSVVDPMPVTESAAEEPSSLAEPTSVVRPAAEAPSSMAEPTSVVRPAAEAPSTMAESTSSVDELPSPGDEAGPKSACEEDDGLGNFHLVPIQDLNFLPFLWKYYGLLGDGNDVAQETNSIALRSLLNRFLKRQLKADRILTMLDYDFDTLRCVADLDHVRLSIDDRREARARGFTRIWKIDWKNYECRHRRYSLCDKGFL
ncbi:hypothetical protein THAOC_15139, partial [Thalassiosira oceanica]